MGKEASSHSHTPFEFTENEQLFDRISHQRFLEFISPDQTTVHEVDLSANSFGEFLFVTVSSSVKGQRHAVTFWGLGYHEHRERWVVDSWSWFDTQRKFDTLLSKGEALAKIESRRNDVLSWDIHTKPSKRAELFALLADLTDEDGALSEIDDLGDFPDE